jgi:hypothetical protein
MADVDADADRTKAMAAVQGACVLRLFDYVYWRLAVAALLDRYKLIAAKRDPGHVVRCPRFQQSSWWRRATLTIQDFDHTVMNTFKLVDAGINGSVVYELHIAPCFSNINSKHPPHVTLFPRDISSR